MSTSGTNRLQTENAEAGAAENPSRVTRSVTIDGQAEYIDPLCARLGDRLSRVLDPIGAFILVDVILASRRTGSAGGGARSARR